MTKIIRKALLVGGVYTDATTAKLSDPTGTYGIKRNDTSAVVVADATVMTKVSTGVYEYSFTDVDGVAYTAYVELVYGGETYWFEHAIPASTITGALTFDFDQLRAEIAKYLGWTRTESNWSVDESTDLNAIIKSGLLNVYYPHLVKPGLAHQWSWMRPQAEITTTAPYTTGTVTIVSGLVSLVGGTWPTWAATDGELVVQNQTYQIAGRDSDSTLTLSDTSVNVSAGATFSLGRPSYELSSDFGGVFDGDLTFKPGESSLYPPVRITSESVLRKCRQVDTSPSNPQFASIRPSTFVATTGQRWRITFYPTPDAAYTLYGRYKVNPQMLDSTNKHPLGGPAIGELILESCLAVAEQRYRDERGQHTAAFMEKLAAAVANDAEAFAPDHLGYNGDRSDGMYSPGVYHRGGIHSFNGTIYYDHNP